MSERIPAQSIETVDPRKAFCVTPCKAGGPIHTHSVNGRFLNLRLCCAGLLFLIFRHATL
ncbi:hypothetical protein [Pseudomonas sp. TMP25]|uniref:hypothetical protein n=1 Tax=Pseudomonas sp. TMP25 TaxID=3136561 RepID=UPI003100D8B2